MFICNYLTKKLRKLYLDYTWFSMVAMHGEDGDRRFNRQFGKKYAALKN